MQIVPYSTKTQQVSFSGTNKIGSISLPNFSSFHFNTKTAPAMSDAKYKEAIVEQAKKDQAAGVLGAHSAGYRSLCKSYISSVSPDRNKIISEGLQRIEMNNKREPKTLNLIDYLFGNVKYHKEKNVTSYAEFYDSNGELVATFSNGGWTSYGTKAEAARENEFIALYNDAWNSAARACAGNVSGHETTEGSIDISV